MTGATVTPLRTRPRLGFLGTGWIGRHRLRALAQSGAAEVAAVADPSRESLEAALADAPGAVVADGVEDLLGRGIDGLVIATPSALHAVQATLALEAAVPVFCQKPLARSGAETAAVVGAAARANRLLGVDLSYRETAAARTLRAHVARGEIGRVHAVDLTFHNAYGPDRPWFLDPRLSGGGCLIDLGTHLVDLLLWTLGFPGVRDVHSRRLRHGRPARSHEAEDLCLATLDLEGGAVARIACSWFSSEGRDAVIEAVFRGETGAVAMSNVSGSFYDFRAELRRGTKTQELVSPPDQWGGRAAVAWAQRLARGERGFDVLLGRELVAVAETIDRMYGR